MYGIPQLHRLMIILRYRLDYIIQLFYKYLFGILSPLDSLFFRDPHGVNETPSPFGDSLYKQRESSASRAQSLKSSPIAKSYFTSTFLPLTM